ncbi:putative thiazole-containing bacteriocin maturation protein [Brevibacillus fluminis]|uniref:Putative thiazole-containing bacteriocin maturation protein n=1 Tax=Brevibacillus fluminis TaxID=511487 RepID=A0A3M8DRC9_9BACL|nr:putative thiazole-containing bacteriocin maturation protein [Brevibacillus fluminis]RNB90700.1 putative thiazole-containing bacteriocin maturation protein [Brevibacillus fluminis]
MTNLNPTMRLKVKRDTFFLPDPNGSVYFRNNVGSFRMEGSGIDQWIEKLLPVFNGEHTLDDLTEGLPDEYRDRVFEIAESLFQNGFVQDVSQELPHQLTDKIRKQYASQIEFLNHFADSGAYRFQCYRQAKVLAVGSGPFFVSLASALLDSGLPKFHLLITDSVPTNRERLKELAVHAHKMDADVAIEELGLQIKGESSWWEAVQAFDFILYVSQEGDVEELRILHRVCREEGKVLLPAMCLQQVGLAGPLVHPDSTVCLESALRRIHEAALSKDPQLNTFSSTAGAMLANVIVFELIKTVTAVNETEMKNHVFLLDLETLEGSWNSIMPHPLVTEQTGIKWVENLDPLLEQESVKGESSGLVSYFSSLTSSKTGIFHMWEEGDLHQLPLAQCRVQAADPLSEGPAKLLPEMVCTGMTHEEARKEAGLAGLEAYFSRMVGTYKTEFPTEIGMVDPDEFVGVGVGETVAESVCRALQQCLSEELGKQQMDQKPHVFRVQSTVEDKHCQFYMQALTTIKGAPMIGLGAEVFGFPVVWVGTGEYWYGSVGLNVTFALRKSLQQALCREQNKADLLLPQALEVSSVLLEDREQESLEIPAVEEEAQTDVLQSALQVLKRNHKQIFLFEFELEPFLKKEMAGVFGVLLREEVSK